MNTSQRFSPGQLVLSRSLPDKQEAMSIRRESALPPDCPSQRVSASPARGVKLEHLQRASFVRLCDTSTPLVSLGLRIFTSKSIHKILGLAQLKSIH